MQSLPGLLVPHFALCLGGLLLFAEVWRELKGLWIFWESSSKWNQICQESWVIAMSLFEHRTYLWSSETFTDHDAEVCSGWNKFMVICQQPCMRASDFFLFTVEGEGPLLLEKREPGKYNVRSKEPLSSTDHSYNFTVCVCRLCHEVTYQMCLLSLSITVLKKQLQTVTIPYFPPYICIYVL